MKPYISVIIPVYNGANYIEEAVTSVLAQDVSFELIIINDCSSDNTVSILTPYLKQHPAIRLVHNEKNLGVAASRNKGVALAEGYYIAFLDADDVWAENKLKEQLALMEQTKAVLSSTARELITHDGSTTGRIFPIKATITYKELLKHNSISCSGSMALRSVLLEFPMKHEDSHEDYITWLKILEKYGYAVGLNKPYLKYRKSAQGKSGSKLHSAKMNFKVYRYLGFSPLKSMFYFISYAFHGVGKYYSPFQK